MRSSGQRLLQQLGVIVIYAALAIAATYPLIFAATRAIPAGGDSWVNYWNLSWVKKAILEQHSDPFFTPDLHFPYGASLYFHTLNVFPAVLALPVTVILGIPAAYNFLVFLSFVLSGYATYRLVLYVILREVKNAENDQTALHLAAFIAGTAFAFCSYRYIHLLGHLDLVSTQWLPLFILFLLKTRDHGSWRNMMIGAFLLAATMLTAAYYVVFLLVSTAVVVAELALRQRRNSLAPIVRIGGILIGFVLIASPVLVPMLVLGRTEGRSLNPNEDMTRFSTDVLAFVIPSPLHSAWREVVRPIYRAIMWPGSNIEIVAFVGFVPLMLALVGLRRCKPIRKLWLPLAILFSILALGPVIHIAGRVILPEISFVMPYRLMSLLPYGDIPRVPARYVVMTILSLSVIAGCGAWFVLQSRTPVVQRAVAVLITVLAVGENAVVPFPLVTPPEPAFFQRIRDDPQRAGVLEVPIPDSPGAYPQRMLYQTIHNKPIYGGYLSRGVPPLPFSAVPGFAQFKALSETFDGVAIYDPAQLGEVSRASLKFYSAGYVVIEKTLMDPAAVEKARSIADDLLGRPARVYEDAEMLAYSVPEPASSAPPAVWLDRGWSYLERLPERGPDGRTLRWQWMGEQAWLGIITSEPVRVRLKFIAQSFRQVRRIRLTANGSTIATIPVTTDRATYETPVFDLDADTKFLEITSLDGASSPGEDTRRLSIALYRVELLR